jgi:hypothetical protein
MIRLTLLLTAALILPATPSRADDYPARKAGLWEISTDPKGPRPMVTRLCTDAATETDLLKKGQATMAEICSRHDMHRSGNAVTTDSVCRPMSSEVTSHSVTTYSGDSAYTTVITSHYNPPFMGKTDSTTTQEAKWLGQCGADMQPGDMIVGGKKLRAGGRP